VVSSYHLLIIIAFITRSADHLCSRKKSGLENSFEKKLSFWFLKPNNNTTQRSKQASMSLKQKKQVKKIS